MFYPPVVIYVLYLGLRFRSWTLTAANPAIQRLCRRVKVHILNTKDALGIVCRAGPCCLLKRQCIAKAEEFLRASGPIPTVLKPDAGQRGSGVAVIRSLDQLCEYLSRGVPCILQEYVPGKEFGVFYYRRPDEARGQVFSVTESACLFGRGWQSHWKN